MGIYDLLKEYCKSDYYAFHMPGHKRNENIDDAKYGFNIDITEIEEFDNLHRAKGIIKDSMDNAARFFGTDRTYFLVNGSSCGVLAAISAVCCKGDKIIVGRNSHKAVYNGVFLNELEVEYFYPDYFDDAGINGGYDSEKLEEIFQKNSNAKAVVITSPTYNGVVSEIEKIAEVTHKYNAVLIVDEAHGAHFGISKKCPTPAYSLGADVVIESLHKTLPAFTQTALLHIIGNRVDTEEIEKYLAIFQTSSPSYVFMANIDKCIRDLQKCGEKRFDNLYAMIYELRRYIKKCSNIKIIGDECIGSCGIFDLDESKIVIYDGSDTVDGRWIYDELRNKYHLQMEMAAGNYVLGITTIGDEKSGFERLKTALIEIDQKIHEIKLNKSNCRKEISVQKQKFKLIKNIAEKSIYEAENCEKNEVQFKKSLNRISGEYIYLYPPGIPLIVPGEIMSKQLIRQCENYKSIGFELCGMRDDSGKFLEVVNEG